MAISPSVCSMSLRGRFFSPSGVDTEFQTASEATNKEIPSGL